MAHIPEGPPAEQVGSEVFEAVASAEDRKEVPRLGAIDFDLRPQSADRGLDGAGTNATAIPPHFLQEVHSRDDASLLRSGTCPKGTPS